MYFLFQMNFPILDEKVFTKESDMAISWVIAFHPFTLVGPTT